MVLLPSLNALIDPKEDFSDRKSAWSEWICLVVLESMMMVGKLVTVCALYAEASGFRVDRRYK
jgi:hypothetical protein